MTASISSHFGHDQRRAQTLFVNIEHYFKILYYSSPSTSSSCINFLSHHVHSVKFAFSSCCFRVLILHKLIRFFDDNLREDRSDSCRLGQYVARLLCCYFLRCWRSRI
ncbi:unnamed protein product [Amoebophrya sp. A120]|nr:unnamed protein product [Amoebophrya sp. A120]|eukprot:GSA120T00002722001.1